MSTIPKLHLRSIQSEDCPIISTAFAAQGWRKPTAQYERYVRLQELQERDIILATYNGEFAGYLTICWESGYAPFQDQGIPEILDFNVLQKFQRQGIGTALMDEAERRIKVGSDYAGIGFGLTKDYGPAQILYVRRGYIPDGNGLAYHSKSLGFGDQVQVDDGLVLYLVKGLM